MLAAADFAGAGEAVAATGLAEEAETGAELCAETIAAKQNAATTRIKFFIFYIFYYY
jgi:hypothetical protein